MATAAQDRSVSLTAKAASKTAVIYARVSSKEQEEEGWSLPAQLRLLQEYAEHRGLNVVSEFVEASTAKKEGRKAFGKMVRYLQSSPDTSVLVEKTDRLYRNLPDWNLIDVLGCELHFVKEGQIMNPGSKSQDKFFHGIKVLMAKNYSENLQEEIKKGLFEKAQQGIYPTHAPLGYLNALGPDGRRKIILPDPLRAPLVSRLFQEYDLGLQSLKTLTVLAWQIGLRTKKGNKVQMSGIQDILKNAAYCGKIRWGGVTYEGTHEPLVTVEMWDRIQDRMAGRCRNKTGFGSLDFAYRGLLTCECGLVMTGERKKKRYVYYHCTGRRAGCDQPYVKEEVITEQMSAILQGMALPPDLLTWLKKSLLVDQEELIDANRATVQRLEADVRRLKQRLERLYNDMVDETLDQETYQSIRAKAQEELGHAHTELNALQRPQERSTGEALDLLELGQIAHSRFKLANPNERHELLTLMCSNCQFDEGKLNVILRKPFDLMRKVAPTSPILDGGRLAKTEENQDWWRQGGSNP